MMDIRKFFGGKPSACSNSKTTEKKPTKVAKESKTSRKTTKAGADKGKSNLFSKCKVVSKENGTKSHEDVTNNNGDSKDRLSDSDCQILPKKSVNKDETKARTNGKNAASGKGRKEAKKNQTKNKPVLSDDDEIVNISDGSDEEVWKKPLNKSKSRNDLSDEETQKKPAKRSSSKKKISDGSKEELKKKQKRKSNSTRDLSDGSDEEVQKRPKKKSKSMKDLSDGSDEEIEKKPKKKSKSMKDLSDGSDEEAEKKPRKKSRLMKDLSDESDEEVHGRMKKKKPKSKKGGVIFDSDSGEEDPLPASHRKTPRRRRKKEVTVVLDSGDEFEPIKDAFAKMTPKIKSPSKPQVSPQKQKPVSVLDFFGAAAVRQEERKTVASKRKSETSLGDKTVESHGDSDFEKTLEQLDSSRKKIKLDSAASADSPLTKASSLASKLSTKVKNFVEETPDKSSTQRVSQGATRGSSVDLTSSPIKSSVISDRKVTPSKVTPSKVTPRKVIPSNVTPSKVTPNKATPSKVTPVKATPTPTKSKRTPVKSTPTRSMSTRSTPGKKSPPGVTGSPCKAVAMKSLEANKTSPQEASPAVKTPHRGGAAYRSYLHREGPRALGSKEIPEGGENCLEGLTFVITGVLESLERDEAQSLIEKYGGKVTKALSKKTSYLVAGRDAGESKMAKAESLKTSQIDEDGLLELIAKRPGKKSKYEIAAEKESKTKPEKKTDPHRTPTGKSRTESSHSETASQERPSTSDRLTDVKVGRPVTSDQERSGESLLWVDKYKPQNMKQIIGQLGDKSNARKLFNWLNNWHRNVSAGKKPAFSRFSDDGSGYRAALLSGPPGIGKTTTAQLVCKEAGFSFVELNASDTRSKKSLQQEVAATLDNTTLTDFYGKTAKSCKTQTSRDCILMDEVDGMAGNEDRGGIQELIQLIKHTKMPIICMCNDRNHMKMRSLSNYTFDLRFQRPRVEQIKAAMMSIAFKEGLKIPPPAMNEIIIASNHDIRQVIHNLSMWTSNDKACSYEQLKSDAKKAKKDVKLGPFDVCRKVFVGGEETSHMTLNDKSDLFFHDYSFGPLFVQENYIHVTPFAARGNACKHLELLSAAADSISDGDLVDRRVRSAQNWNLLPLQAMYASVIPGELMRGSIGQMIQFPSWLGKNSSRTKHDRQTQELTSHMRLRVLTDKNGLNLDYLPHLRRALTEPLIREGQEGVSRVVSLLDDYDLMREDFESIIEATQWPHMKDPMKDLIESKVKAAFTRTYNKEVHLTPYAISSAPKKGKRKGGGGEGDMGEEGEEEAAVVSEESDQEDVSTDGMIKQKKKPRKTSQSKAPADTKKGKGKGAGKGKGKK